MNFLKRLMIGLIRLYQLTLSPWVGRECRYLPTCSQYAIEALERHGALKGGWMIVTARTFMKKVRARAGDPSLIFKLPLTQSKRALWEEKFSVPFCG